VERRTSSTPAPSYPCSVPANKVKGIVELCQKTEHQGRLGSSPALSDCDTEIRTASCARGRCRPETPLPGGRFLGGVDGDGRQPIALNATPRAFEPKHRCGERVRHPR
jgi:hypothetical protein